MSDSFHCQLWFSPSLFSRAFLNMHALHFFSPPYRNQMDVLCSCLCSLKLCFMCGWPNFQVGSILQFGDWSRRMSCRQTDRKTQKAHQPARINASALPVGVPTHSYYENSLSLLFFEQNSASFVVICSRRMQKRVGILYATHFLLLHYIIYSTVYSDERTQDSAIVLSILYSQGEKKPDKFNTVRKVDSLIFFLKSPETQPVCLSGHILT